MSEFHIIGLGNLCEFVIKNIDERQTYGTFSACDKHDRKSMQEFVDYVNQLIKENEQFEKELKVYRKLASCGNCKYHDYDWFDDGDEFEVCNKGNDITEGICEDWEEL